MTRIAWDKVGERVYETGVDHGVLYLPDNTGAYDEGHAWNGLTTVTESPSGADSNKQYADNTVYVNLKSVEEFGATVEAFTYPEAFGQCDGTAQPAPGVFLGQQKRKTFGLSYRTRIGNDTELDDYGYKLHLVWGADAAPSDKAYGTVNDSPAPINFSWALTTTPVTVGVVNGTEYKPAASMVIDSTKVSSDNLAALENALYGTSGADPRLPLPGEVIAMFTGSLTTVETVTPTYNGTTHTVTIPVVAGVVYQRDGETITGSFVITEDTVIEAVPAAGYKFTDTSDSDWSVSY